MSLRLHLLFSLFVFGLSVPGVLRAETSKLFDFRAGMINAEWRGAGDISVEKQADGIWLRSGSSTGMILTDAEPPFFAETALIIASAETPTKVLFIWFYPEKEDGGLTSYYDVNVSSDSENHRTLLLSRHPDWRKEKKTMGFLLPPHSSIVLHRIEFKQWNLWDTVVSALRSVTQLDDYRPYAINFTWGPQLGLNPPEVTELYQNVPPIATSGIWVVTLFIIFCILLYLLSRTSYAIWMRKYYSLMTLLWIACGTWLLLDLYMGVQFLSWVKEDHDAYISGESGFRTFRDRDAFYDFAEFVRPLVTGRERYIFIAETPWPYIGNIRYLTFPSIPAFNLQEDDTWVIYDRSDITLDSTNQLMMGGDVITNPGEVLGIFDEGSFVFRGTFIQHSEPQQ